MVDALQGVQGSVLISIHLHFVHDLELLEHFYIPGQCIQEMLLCLFSTTVLKINKGNTLADKIS